ncbi:MAG: ParB/RepB/Spo0J family partition protein [Desulfamplus sp.]|nr:ParB/RepB/Spo0J family partition protein [Desulfamplus sp.]MBF0257741.1 ParB/RepB/Spo0J family partition protein [Desulfamplus sp.]
MSMNRKTGLGRGISALIPDFDTLDENTGGFFMCRTDDIVPNRFQPRTSFSEEELERLTNSIIEQGILQPLLVRKQKQGGYELIAGERRLRAAKRANLDHVPAIIKDLTDEQMLEVSIIENVQRSNLNPLEEAEAYHRLINEFQYTQEMVAQKIGKNRSTIANFLRLRGLPEPVMQSLSNEEISMGHARAILGAGSEEHQIKTWETVVSRGLSVRATEHLVKKLKSQAESKRNTSHTHDIDYIKSVCSDLTRKISYPVSIKKSGDKGKVEISFRDSKEFERIIELLNKMP